MPSKRSAQYWIFSNIFQNTSWHCKYFWPLRNTLGKHESPLLHAPISRSPFLLHADTTTQCLPICTEKQRSGLFIDWPFKSQHMLLCFYSTVFSEMEHFLILPQGLLLCSGVTRTRCKWEEKVGRNVNWSDTSVNVLVNTYVHVCLCEHFGLFCRNAQRQHIVSVWVVLCNLEVNCLVTYCFEVASCCGVNDSVHRKRESESLESTLCAWWYSPRVLRCQTSQLYFAFHVSPPLKSKSVFLFKTTSWFYPCRFPLLIRPFDHLKHQSITTRNLWFMSPRCPLSAFQGERLPAELLPACQNSSVCGRSEQV